MIKDLVDEINKDIENLEKAPREKRNETIQDIKIHMSKLSHEVDDLKLPVARNDPDFDELIIFCREFIDEIITDGYVEYDYKYSIFSRAIEAIYGNDIINWIDKHNNILE